MGCHFQIYRSVAKLLDLSGECRPFARSRLLQTGRAFLTGLFAIWAFCLRQSGQPFVSFCAPVCQPHKNVHEKRHGPPIPSLSAKLRQGFQPRSDLTKTPKSELDGMKGISILFTISLCVFAAALAQVLRHKGLLPAQLSEQSQPQPVPVRFVNYQSSNPHHFN